MLMATLTRLLAKHGGENVVETLLAVVLPVRLLLTTEAGIAAMLSELVVFDTLLLIFQGFSGFGEIFEFGFSIAFLTGVGVIFVR